jgi:hypothetical protein
MDLLQPQIQDLNRPPIELLESFSMGDIRFLLKTKLSARYVLTLKFGPVGYDSIVNSIELFPLTQWNGNMMIIVILV